MGSEARSVWNMFAPNHPGLSVRLNVVSTLGIYRPGDCTIFPELKTTIHKAQRWEEVPNRREPFAAEMRRSSDRGKAALSTQAKFDLLLNNALSDWFAVQYFAWKRQRQDLGRGRCCWCWR
jgi:hypothetical protein